MNKFYFLLTFFCLQLSFCFAAKKEKFKYDLAICTIFQNEARFLKEWIEFHKLLGVEHFFLYNNNSKDHYREILQPYIDAQEVDLIQWPGDGIIQWNDLQQNAYKDAIKKAKRSVRWLAIIDTDEFLFPLQENNLVTFLRSYEKYPALVVNWQCYGTSNVKRIPDDKLMIETLLYRSKEEHRDNHYVKSIIKPKYTYASKAKVHHFYYHDHKHAINENFEICKYHKTPHVLVKKIRINHYRTRDEEHFQAVKLPRLKKWYEDPFRYDYTDHNTIFDDTILRFAYELRKKIFE